MLFKGNLHYLCLLGYLPNTNFALGSSRDNPLSIRSWSDCSAAMIVGIINHVQKFTRLRQKGSNLTIWPTRNNALSIMCKDYWKAFQTWHLNPQQFLPVFSVPNPDFIGCSSRKYFGVIVRKRNIVNTLIMASISKLRGESCRIDPINVWLGSPSKEVSIVASKGNWSNVAHQLALRKYSHVLNWDSGQLSLSCAND